MDCKLFEAACSGDIDVLHDAVGQDCAVLQKLHSWGTTDTPLHLASMFGHAEFVREYVRLSSISAHQLSQLNQDGYSPLHLASANGHLEIVRFLLEFGMHKSAVEELCMKKDRDGRTALHSAVVTGKIDVIDLLFVHCPDAAKEVTLHQESVLHLAVKHHQQKVLEFLIDQKLGSSVQDLLNRGDRDGNTILHLATAKKQLQTVEYLVKQPGLNVNAENSNCVKPLDILSVSSAFNPNDIYIEKAILHAGGCRSQIATANVQTSPSDRTQNSISQVQDWLKEMRSGILVMASVFVALSFQFALTPPGGMWSDWGPNGAPSNASINFTNAHQPGKPILFDLDRKLFNKLMEFNRGTFFCSIATIILLIQPFSPRSISSIIFGLYMALLTLACLMVEFLYMDSVLTGKSFNITGYLKNNYFQVMLLAVSFFFFFRSSFNYLLRNYLPQLLLYYLHRRLSSLRRRATRDTRESSLQSSIP